MMLFWKKKKSRKNIYKNSVFPRYADKMAGEFDTKKFNCGIYGKNTAVPVAAGETTILSENMRLSIHDEKTHLNNNMFIIADDSYANKLIMANILQCNSSFAVADVGGKMLAETLAELLDAGYDIQVLDVSRRRCQRNIILYGLSMTKKMPRCWQDVLPETTLPLFLMRFCRFCLVIQRESRRWQMSQSLLPGSEPWLRGIDIFLRPEITNLTERNDIILDKAGEKLTGIFVVCPEEKSDADVMANIMMMQLHLALVKTAKEKYNGERLPYLTRLCFNHIERYGGIRFSYMWIDAIAF